MPPRSANSHVVSSNSLCWGSVARASRGDIPKSPASKSAMLSRKAPRRAVEVPGASGSGLYKVSRFQPRCDLCE